MVSKKSSKSPKTMAELLASAPYKIHSFASGQKIKAKVSAILPKSLILDIGGKSEGVVAEKAFVEAKDFVKTLKVGDEVTATVIVAETKDGVTLLSLRQAASEASWERLTKAKEKGEGVAVYGKGASASGITVEVEGQTGFIPSSQLGKLSSKNPQELIGKYFKAKVIEVDKLNNKVVLSEKEVTEAAEMKLAREVLEKIKVGDVYEGEVTTVSNFGVFVRLDVQIKGRRASGPEGLVHISELSWGRVAHPSDIVKEGDKVKVKVIGTRGGRLALSIKQAGADPWENAKDKYKTDSKVAGRVTKISDFGVFVEVEPGVEGLIHITKIPPGRKLKEGEEISCFVEEIDTKNKKLALRLVLTEKPVGYK